jgi:purine-nucleoside phosphorylase
LLLAAFPPELADLSAGPPRGWILACTGVGAVAAAAATMAILSAERPEKVLFVGTCGAYDGRLHVGDILCARDVLAVSLDELQGRAYRPGIERTRWEAGWALPFPAHTVAIPPAITQDEAGARQLATLAAAEHLELSGVFEACRSLGVPVAAALVVVNAVGPGAHAEWERHHEEGSRDLIAALKKSGVFG